MGHSEKINYQANYPTNEIIIKENRIKRLLSVSLTSGRKGSVSSTDLCTRDSVHKHQDTKHEIRIKRLPLQIHLCCESYF